MEGVYQTNYTRGQSEYLKVPYLGIIPRGAQEYVKQTIKRNIPRYTLPKVHLIVSPRGQV